MVLCGMYYVCNFINLILYKYVIFFKKNKKSIWYIFFVVLLYLCLLWLMIFTSNMLL